MTKILKLSVLVAVAIGVLAQSAIAAPASSIWDQPAASLAGQIADILGPGQARLTVENKSSISTSEIPKIRKLLEQDLKTHGVLASGAESASTVRVTLSESKRDRLWVAEVIEGDHTQVTMVDLGPAAEVPMQAASGLTLRAQTILTLHVPVLAALEAPSGLIALEPEQIEFYEHNSSGWQSKKQISIQQKGALARDPRGVLLVAADGQSFEAWLSGTECTGPESVDAGSDWAVECRASDEPWPIANMTSFAPEASAAPPNNAAPQLKAFYNSARDFFTGVVSPAAGIDLPPFYSAGLVPRPAGGAALLLDGIDGKVQLRRKRRTVGRLPARATGAAILQSCARAAARERRSSHRVPVRPHTIACAPTSYPRLKQSPRARRWRWMEP